MPCTVPAVVTENRTPTSTPASAISPWSAARPIPAVARSFVPASWMASPALIITAATASAPDSTRAGRNRHCSSGIGEVSGRMFHPVGLDGPGRPALLGTWRFPSAARSAPVAGHATQAAPGPRGPVQGNADAGVNASGAPSGPDRPQGVTHQEY